MTIVDGITEGVCWQSVLLHGTVLMADCLVMITDESKMLNIFPLAVFTFRIVIQPDLAKDLTLRSSVRFPSKDSAS